MWGSGVQVPYAPSKNKREHQKVLSFILSFSLFDFVQSLTRINSRVAALTEPSLTAGGGRREGAGLCSGRQMSRGFIPYRQMSGTTKGRWFDLGRGKQNKSFQTCEMHCVCEILFRYETYVLRRADLYHFTENFSFLFNNIMNQLLTMKYCCQNIIYSFVLTDFLYIPGETPTFLEK